MRFLTVAPYVRAFKNHPRYNSFSRQFIGKFLNALDFSFKQSKYLPAVMPCVRFGPPLLKIRNRYRSLNSEPNQIYHFLLLRSPTHLTNIRFTSLIIFPYNNGLQGNISSYDNSSLLSERTLHRTHYKLFSCHPCILVFSYLVFSREKPNSSF